MSAVEYLAGLRRRWWVVPVCTAAALVAAFAVVRAQTPVYRAEVTLEVTGRVDHAQILAIDRLLRQISARVTTTSIAEEADRRLGLGLGADAVLSMVHTRALPDTLQIQIDVDDADPTRARRVAAAMAEVMEERQAAQMVGVPAPEQVRLHVVDRPLEVRFVWPQTRTILLAAGLLGLLAGAAIAFVWDYLDDTVKSPRDVERFLGIPLLGVVPVSPAMRGSSRVAPRATIPGVSPSDSRDGGRLSSIPEGDQPR